MDEEYERLKRKRKRDETEEARAIQLEIEFIEKQNEIARMYTALKKERILIENNKVI